MTGDNPGMAAGCTGGEPGAPSHVKRLFSIQGGATGGASRVNPRAIPSANGADSAPLRAFPVVLPVLPSAYGDDYRERSLLTTSIGNAA